MPEPQYISGVCNIGPAEIAMRRTVGWTGLIFTAAFFVLALRTHLNPLWRLAVFFPVFLSAAGFLQARAKFCSGYARRGLYNFGKVSNGISIDDEASRLQDRKRGNQINLYSAVIGAAVAVASVFL